jgi:hypothetical protein
MDLREPQLTADRVLREELRNDDEDRAVWMLAEARHVALKALREANTDEEANGWRDYIAQLAKEIVDQAEQELVALDAEEKEDERLHQAELGELRQKLGELWVAVCTRPIMVIPAIAVFVAPAVLGTLFVWKVLEAALR